MYHVLFLHAEVWIASQFSIPYSTKSWREKISRIGLLQIFEEINFADWGFPVSHSHHWINFAELNYFSLSETNPQNLQKSCASKIRCYTVSIMVVLQNTSRYAAKPLKLWQIRRDRITLSESDCTWTACTCTSSRVLNSLHLFRYEKVQQIKTDGQTWHTSEIP